MTQNQGKFAAAGDALISVTVYKSSPDQKAGIKVVQKPDGGVYITAIAKGGLLDGTRIDVGDKLLSINGRRMRPGQDTRDFMKLISSSTEKVTIVVKKDKDENKETSNKSPTKTKKLVERDVFRAKDGSFDFNINPKIEEFEKSITKFDDDKEQVVIKTKKLFPDQSAGLTFKKKDDMLFVSGITSDSIFSDTGLEFGDRIVSVMDVNFMSYADANYAKTLIKRARAEVTVIVEKGWDVLDKRADLGEFHNKAGKESFRVPKKTGKVKIVKNKDAPPVMEAAREEEEEEEKEEASPLVFEEEEVPLKFSPEASSDRKTVEPQDDVLTASTTAVVDPWTVQTPDKQSSDSKDSYSPQPAIMKSFTPSPTALTPDKESPSPMQNDAPFNGQPRKFLPPMPKENKKRLSKSEVDAGDVVTRMLDKLDNERKAIKERHKMRMNQSFDDSVDSHNVSSQEGSPEKRTPSSTPTRYNATSRNYSPPVKSYANHSPSPTSSGLARTLRKHPHGYLCISVRKKSERSPGIKLRRKDDMFILDKLPHDETRIPLGVQVLAINGNDSFSTVVKATELMDSKKNEVELCVSFEGLTAAWASGENGNQ